MDDLFDLVLQDPDKVLKDLNKKPPQGPAIDLHSASPSCIGSGSAGSGIKLGGLGPPGGGGQGNRRPEVQLASVTAEKAEPFFKELGGEHDSSKLSLSQRIQLYSIIFAAYRPGPAFRPAHVLLANALDARVGLGKETWREYLDKMHPKTNGATWCDRIATIARHCVRLDRATPNQAGSGFLVRNDRILTAGHVVLRPGWLFGKDNIKPLTTNGRVFYNQTHPATKQSLQPEAGVLASDYELASESLQKKFDAALVTQGANWRKLIEGSAMGAEFSGLTGLDCQTTELVEGDLKAQPVAVIGHPLADNLGDSTPKIPEVFGDSALGNKRFMPGFLDSTAPLGPNGTTLKHNCSTLAGASGSCLVLLTTMKVIGIHFRGTVEGHNHAIPTWHLGPWLDPKKTFS